jgi:uncharacterized protein (TIGR03083 family)
MAMALPREEVVTGTIDGLNRFEDFVRSLNDDEWKTPTRCEGWVVADVVAHVSGTLNAVATGALDDFADPGHVARHVAVRKGKSPAELADEIHGSAKVAHDLLATFDDNVWSGPAPAGVNGTLGQGVEAIWYDTYVHSEDIVAALGREPLRGPDMRVAVSHLADELTNQGWGPATLALDGQAEFPVSGGGGRRITGDPLTFILVATGREDPAVLGLDETVNVYRPR